MAATFSLSQSVTADPQLMGIQGYHPRKTFRILYMIWCILMQPGGSYV